MAEALGYSFSPSFQNAEMGKQGGSPRQTAQGAIQTLNYSLPRVAGAATLSPQIGQQPSGGFSNAVIESVLRTVLGSDAMSAVSGFGTGSSMPSGAGGMGGGAFTSPGRDMGASFLSSAAPSSNRTVTVGAGAPASMIHEWGPVFGVPPTQPPPLTWINTGHEDPRIGTGYDEPTARRTPQFSSADIYKANLPGGQEFMS